jgi:hypothetical protein
VPQNGRNSLKTLRIAYFGTVLSVLLFPSFLAAQINSVTFDRLLYLTPNLDSLVRTDTKLGFRVVPPSPTEGRAQIILPSGQNVTLLAPELDWQKLATKAYGTHAAGLVLRVPNALQLYLHLDSLSIPHGNLDEVRTDTSGQFSFGIDHIEPLDLTFVSSNPEPTPPTTDTTLPPNRFRRISWLVLTASAKTETLLRRVFDALELTMKHEGCCDYWLVGPPDNRIAIRFEVPEGWPRPIPNQTTYEGWWLSIEDGDVIYAY